MSQKILIVDDEKDIVDVLTELLKLEGFEVICAYNAKSALIKFQEFKPDLIITDMMMPGMSGEELIIKIREGSYNHNVPIIMMSAKSSVKRSNSNDEAETTTDLWDYFIKKPCDVEEVLKCIDELLKNKNASLSILKS